jgi:hypothetical protein
MRMSVVKQSIMLNWREAIASLCATDRVLTFAVVVVVGVLAARLILPAPVAPYAIGGLIIGALPAVLAGMPGTLLVITSGPQVAATSIADFLTVQRYVLSGTGLAGSQWRHDVPRMRRWTGDEVTVTRDDDSIAVRGPVGLLLVLKSQLTRQSA